MMYLKFYLSNIILCLVIFGTAAQKPKTLVQELEKIQANTALSFSYDYDLVTHFPDVKLSLKNLTESQILDQLTEKTCFNFSLVDSVVLVALKPQFQEPNFTFRVIDDYEEGVPGLSIINNSIVIAETDIDGKATVSGGVKAYDKVGVAGFGFDTVQFLVYEMMQASDKKLRITTSTYQLATMVIEGYLGSGVDAYMKDQTVKINTSDMALFPGETEGDVLRSIQTLPGIKSNNGRAGSLFIRGSTPDQTLIAIDGIPVYHFGHYFGTISPYNPQIVQGVEVSGSGYTAQRGGRAGAMIDIITQNEVIDSARYGVSLNTIYAGAYAVTPTKDKKVQFLLSARSSYPVSWQPPKLQAITESVFAGSQLDAALEEGTNLELDDFEYHFDDVNAKILLAPSSRDKISVSGLWVNNILRYNATDQVIGNTQQNRFSLNNQGLSASWKRNWKKGLSTNLKTAYSYYDIYSRERVVDLASNTERRVGIGENTVHDYSISAELEKRIQANVLAVGYAMNYYDVSFDFRQKITTSDDSAFKQDVGAIHAMYFNYQMNYGKKLSIVPGLRMNYFSGDEKIYPEPRIFTNYAITESIMLKASFGLFHQFISQALNLQFSNAGFENQLWLLANDDDVKASATEQYMAGALFRKDNWTIDIEGFYKKSKNLTIFQNAYRGVSEGFFPANANTVGINTMVKKKWGKHFDSWVSYTLSESLLEVDTIGSEQVPNYFDQPHVLNVVALYSVKRWKFSLGWNYASGLPVYLSRFSPLVPPNGTAGGPPRPGPGPGPGPGGPAPQQQTVVGEEYEGDRYPAMHSMDISMVYGFPKNPKKWKGSIGISIVNVYDQKNLIVQKTRVNATERQYINSYAIGFSPNLALNLEW